MRELIHTATQTSKFKRLVRRVRSVLVGLPIDPETVCVGLLERLWHTTITSAICGDIGKLDDEEIAEAIGWHGDAQQIISILVESGWLDECTRHRLLVHDWADHAPRHVKGNVCKVGGFAIKEPPLGPRPKGPALKEPPLGMGASNETKRNVTEHNEMGDEADAAPSGDDSRPSIRAEDIPIPESLDTPDFRRARDDWFSQRRRRRLSVRPEHISRQYELLLPLGPQRAADCVRYTIDNDYQALCFDRFSEKPNATKHRKHNTGSPVGSPGRGDI